MTLAREQRVFIVISTTAIQYKEGPLQNSFFLPSDADKLFSSVELVLAQIDKIFYFQVV